jgi:hypothetical protein
MTKQARETGCRLKQHSGTCSEMRDLMSLP